MIYRSAPSNRVWAQLIRHLSERAALSRTLKNIIFSEKRLFFGNAIFQKIVAKTFPSQTKKAVFQKTAFLIWFGKKSLSRKRQFFPKSDIFWKITIISEKWLFFLNASTPRGQPNRTLTADYPRWSCFIPVKITVVQKKAFYIDFFECRKGLCRKTVFLFLECKNTVLKTCLKISFDIAEPTAKKRGWGKTRHGWRLARNWRFIELTVKGAKGFNPPQVSAKRGTDGSRICRRRGRVRLATRMRCRVDIRHPLLYI